MRRRKRTSTIQAHLPETTATLSAVLAEVIKSVPLRQERREDRDGSGKREGSGVAGGVGQYLLEPDLSSAH